MNKDMAMDLVVDWLDKNVVSAYPEKSLARFTAYVGLGAGRVLMNDKLENARGFLESIHVLSGDDLDLNKMHDLAAPALEKAGAVEREWLGMKFTFKPDNLEDLFRHLQGARE